MSMRLPTYQIPCSGGGLWDHRVLLAASSSTSNSIYSVSAVGRNCHTALLLQPGTIHHSWITYVKFLLLSVLKAVFTAPENVWIPEAVSSTPPNSDRKKWQEKNAPSLCSFCCSRYWNCDYIQIQIPHNQVSDAHALVSFIYLRL